MDGLTLFSAGKPSLNKGQDLAKDIGGAVSIFFGLLLVGLFRIPLLMRTVSLRVDHKPVGYVGAFLVAVG